MMKRDSNWLLFTVLAVAVFALTMAVGQVWPGHPEPGGVQAEEATGDWEVTFPPAPTNNERWSYAVGKAVELERRGRQAAQVNVYYAHRDSPMVGTGEIFVRESERTGIPASLPAAISESESSTGKACFAPFNFWGGLAYPGGFGSWDESIVTLFDWLVDWFGCPQTPYDCPGYCEPSQPWQDNTWRVQEYIQNMEV